MSKIRIMSWGCPNCFEKLSGLSNEDGYTRLICHKCGSLMVMKRISRRKHLLEITAPERQTTLYG